MSPPSFARPLGQNFQFPASFKQPAFDPKARKGPKPAWGHVWMAPGCQGVLACCSFGRGSHVFGLCLYLPERDPKAAVVTPAVETAAIGPQGECENWFGASAIQHSAAVSVE